MMQRKFVLPSDWNARCFCCSEGSGGTCSPVGRRVQVRTVQPNQNGAILASSEQTLRTPQSIRFRRESKQGHSTIRSVLFLLFYFIFAFASFARGMQPGAVTARIEGTVFVKDSTGNRSSVAGATVKLNGPAAFETETDENGEYVFSAVAPGTYEVTASAPGLEGWLTLEVGGNKVHLSLELKPTTITDTVVVKGEEADNRDATPSETVSATTLRDAPNVNERFESSLPLIPGVVRGPDGHINLKGTRSTQSGALVNSANVTDPVTGSPAINLPVDVVASVKVISNPYDPQYGKFTGAVSSVETKTSDFEKFHYSFQNFVPRLRDRDGMIRGIGGATPRLTFTGPLVKNKIAITQSFEYRFVQTPVNSLPPSERDTKLESFDSYTQLDYTVSTKHTASVSLAFYPQKLDYLGLNTFTTQQSTPDFHQRGYQLNVQDNYSVGSAGLLSSQLSYKRFDADITAQSDDPYRMQLETTEGGFFNRQTRRTSRAGLQENYRLSPRRFAGSHQFIVGLSYERSHYAGRQTFLPVELDGVSDLPVERITFTPQTSFHVTQNETAWFAGDQWAIFPRLTLDLGVRFDYDSITGSSHAAPRAGFLLALTSDGKTLLKGGAGLFYDRVPLMAVAFVDLPDRTVSILGPTDQPTGSVAYKNKLDGGLRNPRSTSWSLELDRQVLRNLSLRLAYEQRNTSNDFVVSPLSAGSTGVLALSNGGSDSYREFQVAGRYRVGEMLLNASYVRSRAFGDLNDLNQFFGNLAQPVIQPDARGRLSFDAPNRYLLWGSLPAPWKLTIVPVYDLHTGFPYSVQDQFRAYVGPRNVQRFPTFSSFDIQITRRISLPLLGKRVPARVGGGVFNLFNHFNPRDVQNNLDSPRFGGFFNSSWREYRGKFVLEF